MNEKTITIQHDNTQLRDGPSTDHDIIYFADKGIVFDIVDVHNDWYEVTSKDTTGFVLKQLVTNKAGTISDRKSTRLNSSHVAISYAVFCLKKKIKRTIPNQTLYIT